MRIIWTEAAQHNLKQIEKYISENNSAALNSISKIIKRVGMLADNPAIGRNGRIFNTRELIITGTPYIVPYRVRNEQIEILSVLHSKMQWPDLF